MVLKHMIGNEIQFNSQQNFKKALNVDNDFTFWEYILNFSITSKKHGFPMFDQKILIKIT